MVNDIYVIADSKLARLILEGDDSRCLRSADKTNDYAKFEYLTVGIKTVFTKKTYAQGPGDWFTTRKAMAPSFSTKNLLKQLPVLQAKLDELFQVLGEFATAGAAVDIAELMVNLSVDFILASMFGVDCRTLEAFGPRGQGKETVGQRILKDVELSIKELNNIVYFPLREWHFWSADVHNARRASRDLLRIAKDLLRDYRAAHPAGG